MLHFIIYQLIGIAFGWVLTLGFVWHSHRARTSVRRRILNANLAKVGWHWSDEQGQLLPLRRVVSTRSQVGEGAPLSMVQSGSARATEANVESGSAQAMESDPQRGSENELEFRDAKKPWPERSL